MLITKIKMEKKQEKEYIFESPDNEDPQIVMQISIERANKMSPDFYITLITQDYI